MTLPAGILLLAFFLLLLLNVPIAFAIGIASALAIHSAGDAPTTYIVAQRMIGGIDSFPLLAIPLFILAGNIMGRGGVASRLVQLANALVGSLPGGLAYVNTLTCMLFGSISGSSAAAISSIGGFMIPEMEKAGYRKEFSVALTTCAATTGLIIPPSNIMIVYAVVAQNVSIAALFVAGVLPGIAFGLSLMLVAAIFCGRHAKDQIVIANQVSLVKAALSAIPSLMLIVIVLGGILGGFFSATEASAMAVAYAYFLACIVYRELKHKELHTVLVDSGKTTAVVLLLIGASQAMSWFLVASQIPQAVSEALLQLTDNRLTLLLLINILLLGVGIVLDMTPAVLIATPIFLPAVMELGVSPVHFGIIMIANLCIGLCTPPVGTCLFLGCSVGNVPISKVTRSMLPFYAAMIVALAVITYWPSLSLILPRMMGLV
ncbi:TRAP transporter large permease [Bythopirellula polymerisocia]|uniref:Sialic acid TRAP transporter permease protein SiaT n=1 Tax=Bythopirellula polymerisocia TaxID=2528003 RepID=A0A5C6CT66_9BACT|nr:TRAP transporter large permease [Bythopirellula polymerisocia]TWU27578.1 Sialic acid TRAP transporter permease protein SiaT [Bythopirellula polymerisocia]